MKKITVLFYLLVNLFLIGLGVNLTLGVLTSNDLYSLMKVEEKKNVDIEDIGKCTSDTKISGLDNSSDRRISKLYEYQEICGSFVTDKLMLFTTMPNSTIAARRMGSEMAATLKEFKRNNITPLVVIEPENEWGLVDFEEFKTGFYDNWIKEYFISLKNEGIVDEDMGIWIPFPEANIPSWNKNGTTPADFARIYNSYTAHLKSEFPNAKTSILLNSATYDNTDFDWAYGEYISLKPYLEDINPDMVDSFGLQGFPWIPPANSPSNNLVEPSEYLNYMIAIEAARILGVNEIWFNTGTFSKKYAQDINSTSYLSYLERKTIFDKTIEEILKVQSRGFKISVNIFSEDKSNTAEQTDWSYWTEYGDTDNKDALVFKDAVAKFYKNNINVSLYDAYPVSRNTTTPSPSL